MLRITDAGEIEVLSSYFGNIAKETTMSLILFTAMKPAPATDGLSYGDFTQPPASCGYVKKTFTMASMPAASSFTNSTTYDIPTAVWAAQNFVFTGPIPVVPVSGVAPIILYAGTISVIGYALCCDSSPYNPLFWELLTTTAADKTETIFTFTPLANADSLTITLALQLGNGIPN